jgi:putative N6-adenine-specific DNA methylase
MDKLSERFRPEKLRYHYFASCPTELEDFLEKEILELGIKEPKKSRGGVSFTSPDEKALELILSSRVASRVYKVLYHIPVDSMGALYEHVRAINWKNIFNVDQTFRVAVTLGRLSPHWKEKGFSHTLFLAQKIKDGLVDRFRSETGVRPSVNVQNADVTIMCHFTDVTNDQVKKDKPEINVAIMLDLCREPLSDRGYRALEGEKIAPMRENLAAAIAYHMNWKPEEEFLIDIMAGSGTLAAESYLLAKKIPPSVFKLDLFEHMRDELWAFQRLPWFQKDQLLQKKFYALYEKYREQCAPILDNVPDNSANFNIQLNDRHPQAIKSLHALKEKFNWGKTVTVTGSDATIMSFPQGKKLLFANPPYGERLMQDQIQELEDLYYLTGELFKKKATGSRAFILTGDPMLLKKISLRPSKKAVLYNGPIECRLAEYHLY